jgi:deoxycytidine triphosphate deaminase
MLTDTDIANLKLVRLPDGTIGTPTEPSAFSLTIGTFLEPDPQSPFDNAAALLLRKLKRSDYRLKPQEMVWAVSKEVVVLPRNVTGYLHMKTGLATRGIMSITTGMIDPTWTGPISVLLVNFSEREIYLDLGEEFLRVTFHQHGDPSQGRYDQQAGTLQEVVDRYVRKRQKEVRVLPAMFLNLKGHSDEIAAELRKDMFGTSLWIAGIAAVFFAIGAVFIPIGVDLARSAVPENITQPLADDLSKLEDRVNNLEETLRDQAQADDESRQADSPQ